jgi:hypothetical protein
MQSALDQQYQHDDDDDDDGDSWIPLEQQTSLREPAVVESMANQPHKSPAATPSTSSTFHNPTRVPTWNPRE